MRLIDTHAHYNDSRFREDLPQAIARAREAGVCKILHPDIDSSEREDMMRVVSEYPGFMFRMAGLYPGSVDGRWEEEVELAFSHARGAVAIGEIGLDYHWDTTFAAEQRLALKRQLEMAARLNLPVNIHLRDATEDFFKVLEECSHLGLRGNMHAFSGSSETFFRLQKYGQWSVGIGGVVTYKNSKVAAALEKIPLDAILLETDAPYLPPVPHRGERNESAYLPLIAETAARIKGVDVEEAAEITSLNAEKLFGI